MATKVERARDVLAAIKNVKSAEVGDAELLRTTTAFVLAYQPDDDPATMTPAERSTVFLRAVRRFVGETVHSQDIEAAVDAARQAVVPPDYGND